MKLRNSIRRTDALTLIEVLVVVFVAVLAALLIPGGPVGQSKAELIACQMNLKQICLAFRVWDPSQIDEFPTQVSAKMGGVKELAATGNVTAVFQLISNELNNTKILTCYADAEHHPATNWTTDFGNKNISYFVGLDASEDDPDSILTGDDNFAINGAESEIRCVSIDNKYTHRLDSRPP